MKLRAILGLLVVLMFCSCSPKMSNSGKHTVKGTDTDLHPKTGLRIEYGPNLGITHTDNLGNPHFYVHITATITNDSPIPILLQFALANEYEYPTFCGDDKYKVFLLPEEFTPYNKRKFIAPADDCAVIPFGQFIFPGC